MEPIEYLKPSKRQRQKRRDKRLAEELVECRRGNGGDANKKYREKSQYKRLQNDLSSETPRFRSSYRDNRGDTYLNDNLEPLIRFLQSHVGQLWDKVYSKLSQQLDKRSTSGIHVFDHLLDFVVVNTIFKDGKVILISRHGDHSPIFNPYWSRFYVHPTTKLLTAIQDASPKGPYPKKARWKKAKAKQQLKIRLGIQDEKKPRYHFKHIKTYGKYLTVGEVYDLRINDIGHESQCRVKLIKIGNAPSGVKLVVKVLKSKMKQKEGTIILSSKSIESRHYYNPTAKEHYYDWRIFNTGTFFFDAKKNSKKEAYYKLRL